jgi:hypothetical protein
MKITTAYCPNLKQKRPSPAGTLLAVICACFFAGLGVTRAQDPTVTPNYDSYFPGEDIIVSFTHGPGNPLDWIGIYPEETVPGTATSTLWYYVDGTRGGATGVQEGNVVFPEGLSTPGNWSVYLLLNDGYNILASNLFHVLDSTAPAVRTDRRSYAVGAPITITFTNGPGNAKDWVGIYREDQTPGGPASTLWNYVDGTQNGNDAKTDGTMIFSQGLSSEGRYVAYFLLNDGYDILASNAFQVVQISSQSPRVISSKPANNSTGLPPIVPIVLVITNGTTKVTTNSIVLSVDGIQVIPAVAQSGDLLTISYTNQDIYTSNSAHIAVLRFGDNAIPAQSFTNEIAFAVGEYRNLVLPAPLYFEDFDRTPEGQLPAGWSQVNYTEVQNPDIDFGNLDSAAYATWTVVNADRFKGSFITYSNPDASQAEKDDYHRVLSINPFVVVNGKVLNEPLAKGRFLFGDSGYRNGASQVMFAFTPDFNLSGKTNVHVSFHSLWEQNQDSIGAVEYSVDQGANWLPVVYLLEAGNVLTATNEVTGETMVDAVATFTTDYADVAHYTDENGVDQGGTYGAFIAAPISTNLAAFISPRIDNDPVGSKRIELFRLPQADNQAKVRFRFAHAGTDSWYFGIDDFGLYSIGSAPPVPPKLTIIRSSPNLLVSWPGDAAGYTLESTTSLNAPSWAMVSGVVNNSVIVTPAGTSTYYRLRQ